MITSKGEKQQQSNKKGTTFYMKRTHQKKKPIKQPKPKVLKSNHRCKFAPAIAFDWQGISYEYGKCKCGNTDM